MLLSELDSFWCQHRVLARHRGKPLGPPLTVLRYLPFRFGRRGLRSCFPMVDPAFDPNQPVRGLGLSKPIVDVGSHGTQWHLTLAISLCAGNLCPSQPTGAYNLNSLSPKPHRGLHGFFHRPPERYPSHQLGSNLLSDQLGVQLRPSNFDDVKLNRLFGHTGKSNFQLVDLGTFLSDDNTWPRGMDHDTYLIGLPLDIDPGHPSVIDSFFDEAPEFQVFM